MVLWAYKLKHKPFGLVCYKENGLYYLRLTNTNILVYGSTIEEAFDNILNLLDTLMEDVKAKKLSPDSLLRKDSFSEKLEYILGLILAWFRFRNIKKKSNDKINNLDSDIGVLMHA